MRKFTRIMALMLSAVMLVVIAAGCGSSEQSSGDAVLKIGGIGPVTGDASTYGIAVQNGAELAVKEINEAGGINGMKIEFKFEDDVHNEEKAVNAYNTLKDWGMQALVGTVTSAPCIAVSSQAATDNMFMLTPSASSVDVLEGKTNVFQVCFTDPNQGITSADYIADNNLATKIAVIYDSSDVYSSGIYEAFAVEAQAKSLEIVSAEAFTGDSKTDFSVQLSKAKDSGAELIFLPIYYNEAALILKQANDLGITAKFCGGDGLDGLLAVENFDVALAEGVMLLTPFSADAPDEFTSNFVKSYQKAYGEGQIPNQFAADAYDAVYIIAQALKDQNVSADISASDLCELLKTRMTSMSYDGVTGEGMTWDATGVVSKELKAMIIENGAYKEM